MLSRPSAIFLIVANLVPLGGVLLFDWHVFDVMILYWLENVVIGLVNVLRMLVVARAGESGRAGSAAVRGASRARRDRGGSLLLIPFFAVHYGIFCFGHYVAVMAIFGDAVEGSDVLASLAGPVDAPWRSPLVVGVVAIAASHLFSFYSNFVSGGEYRRARLAKLMHRPYGRIVILHIAIIAGGALVQWLGSTLPMLVVLIALKIGIDLRLHARERHVLAGGGAGSDADVLL